MTRRIALIAGPLLFVLVFVFWTPPAAYPHAPAAAGLALWMVAWWITEAVPLAATALLPLAVLPLVGALSGKTIAVQYVNHVIFLFLGGFLIAIAMQRWRLHERIALHVLLRFGRFGARGLVAGAMAASWLLSMWISNTATTMMMTPILLAVLAGLPKEREESLAAPLLLGAAYAASIGGVATLVGTAPNLSFARILEIQFPEAPEVGFAEWMRVGLPVSAAMLLVAAFAMVLRAPKGALAAGEEAIRARLAALGPMRPEEWKVLGVFVLTALAWITRRDLDFGAFVLPGWAHLLPAPKLANDGVVAAAAAVLLFMLPAREGRLLDARAFRELPWDVVLLLGGGFALAYAIRTLGLAAWLGQELALAHLPGFGWMLAVGYLVVLLTEVTSNTATAETLLPIFAAASVALHVHPLALMLPATMACSMAFMLPAATPPNAIVFGTGRVSIRTMVRHGVVLALAAPLVITLVLALVAPAVFGSLSAPPGWAR